MNIGHDIGFPHVYEEIVFQLDGPANFGEDSIADLQVFDEVVVGMLVISDLELSSSMPVLVFFLANWNDEIIYYFMIRVV